MLQTRFLPHPIPYQGSKRNLADDIMRHFPDKFHALIEPFAGSAAITIAAAANQRGERYAINDLNVPLMTLWRIIIDQPGEIAAQYGRLWKQQLKDPRSFYDEVRAQFNSTGRADLFLYLLARCVKGSVRYNSRGEFNQSPDNRRLGMRPETMARHLHGVSFLLKNKTTLTSTSYLEVLDEASQNDLVYMDPPYQGVCGDRDTRYLQSVPFEEFADALSALNSRGIRYLVSYDGRTGEKVFGRALPESLDLTLVELDAGRSTQATLLGKDHVTIESLYISPALAAQGAHGRSRRRSSLVRQLSFAEACR